MLCITFLVLKCKYMNRYFSSFQKLKFEGGGTRPSRPPPPPRDRRLCPKHFAIGYAHTDNLPLGNIALQYVIQNNCRKVWWCFLMISCTFWRSRNWPKLSCGFKASGSGNNDEWLLNVFLKRKYTERQNKLITSLERHTLKSKALKWIIIGDRLAIVLLTKHIKKKHTKRLIE